MRLAFTLTLDGPARVAMRRFDLAAAVYCLAYGHQWCRLPDGRRVCCGCGAERDAEEEEEGDLERVA